MECCRHTINVYYKSLNDVVEAFPKGGPLRYNQNIYKFFDNV